METVSIDDFIFEVDKEETSRISKELTRCSCPACENFRKNLNEYYPEIIETLKDLFGIDYNGTASNKCFTLENNMIEYFPKYIAVGKTDADITGSFKIGKCSVSIEKPEGAEFEEIAGTDGFIISLSDVVLPYDLDIPLYIEPKEPIVKRGIFKKISDRIYNWVFKK